jgi:hypothetical protein
MSLAADRPQVPAPATLLRLGRMVKQLLAEIHALPLDDAGRARMVATHVLVLAEIEAVLPVPLRRELDAIAPHLRVGAVVSDAELRIAHAQLAGWLEGVFQGVQFATETDPAAADGCPALPARRQALSPSSGQR